MGRILESRRASSAAKLHQLHERLTDAEALASDAACVYVTGSYGRGEASSYSDLDVFLLGETSEADVENAPEEERRLLPHLSEIEVQAALIRACRELDLPEFSGDGEHLRHYTIEGLIKNTGSPQDDSLNTFTARLLLILESRPLLGESLYDVSIGRALGEYWGDFEGHKGEFRPGYLINDILRMWRTFCVNYEHHTKTDPPERKAKRRIKHYKLAHSRLLTCFSMIAVLLEVFDCNGTVTCDDAIAFSRRTPTERIEDIGERAADPDVVSATQDVLRRYEAFLHDTDAAEDVLRARFQDRGQHHEFKDRARGFGDSVARLLAAIGGDGPLYRLLVV